MRSCRCAAAARPRCLAATTSRRRARRAQVRARVALGCACWADVSDCGWTEMHVAVGQLVQAVHGWKQRIGDNTSRRRLLLQPCSPQCAARTTASPSPASCGTASCTSACTCRCGLRPTLLVCRLLGIGSPSGAHLPLHLPSASQSSKLIRLAWPALACPACSGRAMATATLLARQAAARRSTLCTTPTRTRPVSGWVQASVASAVAFHRSGAGEGRYVTAWFQPAPQPQPVSRLTPPAWPLQHPTPASCRRDCGGDQQRVPPQRHRSGHLRRRPQRVARPWHGRAAGLGAATGFQPLASRPPCPALDLLHPAPTQRRQRSAPLCGRALRRGCRPQQCHMSALRHDCSITPFDRSTYPVCPCFLANRPRCSALPVCFVPPMSLRECICVCHPRPHPNSGGAPPVGRPASPGSLPGRGYRHPHPPTHLTVLSLSALLFLGPLPPCCAGLPPRCSPGARK